MTTHRAGGRRAPQVRGGLPPAAMSPQVRTRMAGLVILVTVGFVAMGMGMHSSAEPPSPGPEQTGSLGNTSTASAHPALDPSKPVRLEVSAVGIDTKLVELGLNPDQTLEVPANPLLAGWYSGSPAPGQRGPSVIAGHVDSNDGPAVFYRLGQVQPGDQIQVTLQDDEIASFTVTGTRSYPQKDFPTQTVYGNTDRATLRLITCGDWNIETEQYDANVVVFAQLDPPRS